LTCQSGCRFPIIGGIPRFVDSQHYTSGFGAQWNVYRTTQLDSFTGLTISRDRLNRLSGGSLGIFQGKQVLEAGCGAGRFTEILLANGANVFAVDLSEAVTANYQNFADCSNYFISQADMLNLPVEPEQFDIVVCVGVIQHSPNPEATMSSLCSYLKPGGYSSWIIIRMAIRLLPGGAACADFFYIDHRALHWGFAGC
jgi:2-polyprenyl-3-methyl-5-hydroxy-6-metoxy-1,4-benzoquinol methylase